MYPLFSSKIRSNKNSTTVKLLLHPEMGAQGSVVLYFVGYDIQHIPTQAHVGFYDRYEILAVIRVHPHAILKPLKAEPREGKPDLVAGLSSPLGYVEHEHPPFAVPALRLFGNKRPFPYPRRKPLAFLRKLQPLLAVFFCESYVPRFYKTAQSGRYPTLLLVQEFCFA